MYTHMLVRKTMIFRMKLVCFGEWWIGNRIHPKEISLSFDASALTSTGDVWPLYVLLCTHR